MSRCRTSVTIDALDIQLLQRINRNLRPLADQISSDEQHSKVLHYRSSELRSDIIQRCKLRNSYYYRKLPRFSEELQLIRSDEQSLRCKAKSYDQSIRLYQHLIQIQSASEVTGHQQQLEQSTKILETLKNDVHQCEKDIDQLKNKLEDQAEQMQFYSTNLFQIQFEQEEIQLNIKQLKEEIRREETLYQNIKQQLCDLSLSPSAIPNEPQTVFDRETLRAKFFRQPTSIQSKVNDRKVFMQQQIAECENQQLALGELRKERQMLIDRETVLNGDLQKLRDSNETQTNRLTSESTHLSTRIDTIRLDLERLLVDSLPLQFEISVYHTLLGTQEMSSIQETDHLTPTDQCQVPLSSSEQAPPASRKLQRIKCKSTEGKEGERDWHVALAVCLLNECSACYLGSHFRLERKRGETRLRPVISLSTSGVCAMLLSFVDWVCQNTFTTLFLLLSLLLDLFVSTT